MPKIDSLLHADRPFLTDAGLETWLFFQQGFEAPEFAAIALMDDDRARSAMQRYFREFLELARQANTGFVLDTATWRGCVEWASRLGRTREQMLDLSAAAVEFAQKLRREWHGRLSSILINGVVGPAGDGYRPGAVPSSEKARALHAPQIRAMAEAGVDMISAITMTNVGEAVGITQTARDAGLPVVVSFTVETDGRLPTGDMLGEAIEAVDRATGNAPAYFMVNCAHPDHFRDVLASGADWISRIGGVRANASRLSHEELDNATELDEGDPEEFGRLHAELSRFLPNLRVMGGCCGSDHRHVGSLSRHLHTALAH